MNKNILGGISPKQFLKKYWQKKPLLIRNAFPDFKSPLSPKEFLDFSCSDDVSSRLVIEQGGEYAWQVLPGPLSKKDLKDIPKSHWTVLIQEMNAHYPEISELLDSFKFIPNWRIDDVMVSYAVDQGSVGPHTDNYDVFLLQGLGKRKWKINYTPVEDERLIDDLDIRILDNFSADEEWILNQGDMLYLPPKIAHYGIAEGESMTFSIGFRTPSHKEILLGIPAFLMEYIAENAFYEDSNLKLQDHPGEIKQEAVSRIQKIFTEMTRDKEAVERWLGQFVTEPKRGLYVQNETGEQTENSIKEKLDSGLRLKRKGATKIAHINSLDGTILLFVNGEEFDYDPPMKEFIEVLTAASEISSRIILKFWKKKTVRLLVAELINNGSFELK